MAKRIPEESLAAIEQAVTMLMSSNDTHTLRLMAKKAAAKKAPPDFGGETLSERLTRLRKQRGFTQVELAEKVGFTQVLISAYETDRCYFSGRDGRALCLGARNQLG